MAELDPTSMEEDDERPDVLLAFERDLDEVCGGIQHNSRPHTPEWLASTSGRVRAEPQSRGSSSNSHGGRRVGLPDEISPGERSPVVAVKDLELVGERRPGRTLHCRDRGDCSGSSRLRMCGGRGRPGSRICGSVCKGNDEGKGTSKRDKQDLGRSFQLAVSVHDWPLAESFIPLADPQRLNDGLCIALDSVWFLSTPEELDAAMKLIEKLIEAGASDFTRAALRTSFLASCVSACRSRTMSLADTVTVMAQRLRERLQECNGDEDLKVEAAAKVQRFTEWALKCIGSHSRGRGIAEGECCSDGGMVQSSSDESKLQLTAFKRFLELAGDRLTEKDYTEAFDAACFPLTLFSSAIDPGWATGIAASAMQGLLGSLVEGGADNANQCFLEAARFGSTELVRILLQIGFSKSVKLDVDLALGFASHYCKISTMECLVVEGNAEAFLGPLMRAAERGCMEVVQWFVERGCKDMELCLALTAAASSSHIDVAEYLLRHVPRHVIQTLSAEIIKAAGERSGGSLRGIAFLLQADFLNNGEATYKTADNIAKLDDEAVTPELRAFLQEEWSEEAYFRGRMLGQAHHLNVMRALKKGCSPLHLQELPVQLQVTVAYLPLYKECSASRGVILSQWLRGQLVEAVLRLNAGTGVYSEESIVKANKDALLSILESRLPGFLLTRL